MQEMNSDLLKGKIREKAMTQGDIADRIGISLSRFNAKLNGSGGAEFTLGEVQAIKTVLDLDSQQVDQIFFSVMVS